MNEVMIEGLYSLIKNWREVEKTTDEIIWGECAQDLEDVIESFENQM